MSTEKFATWLRQQMQEHCARPTGAEDTQARVARVLTARQALGQIQGRLSGALPAGAPLFGAFIADEHLPGLRASIGAELDARLAQLDAELRALLAALSGAPPMSVSVAPVAPAPSIWTRMKAVFGAAPAAPTPAAPPSVSGVEVDRPLAQQLSKSLPADSWLSLFADAPPQVQQVLLSAPPTTTEARLRVEDRLNAARDEALIELLTQALGAIGAAESEPVLRAVLWRTRSPELRSTLISALVRVSPHTAKEFASGSVADRLAVLDARRSTPEVVEHLRDPSPEVVAAAAEAIANLEPRRVLAGLLGVLRDGPPSGQLAALDALHLKGEFGERVLFEPLLSLATGKPGPVRVRANELLARLAEAGAMAHSDYHLLEVALPKLDPGSPAALAVQLRRERHTVHSTPTYADLEDALEDPRADEQAWLVYADALQSKGDARGELIMLASQGKPTRGFIEEHAAELLGEVPALLQEDFRGFLDQLTWRHGLVESATVKLSYRRAREVTLEALLAAVLSAPAARFLSGLKLGLVSDVGEENDYTEVVQMLRPRGQLLRELVLGEFDYPDEMEISWAPWGDVSQLWLVAPALEALHLRGSGGVVGPITAPALRSLIIETGGLQRATFEAVLNAQAPRLERLELWFGNPDYGAQCGTADVERLLARPDLRLHTLGLKNADFVHEVLPLLARSPVLRGLKQLDLSLGALLDDDVDVLLRHAAAFAHLERLDLRRNQLEARLDEVRRALPHAVLEDQRSWEDAGYDEPERYVAVGE